MSGSKINSKHAWIVSPLLLLAYLVISMTGCAFNENKTEKLPLGWQIVRPPTSVLALAIQGDTIWVGGKDGVYALDKKSGTIITELTGNPRLTYVKSLLIDRAGVLYIGHFNGLTRYDGSDFQTYTTKDGLPDNRVNALLQDREGRLWVGTWGGVAVLNNGKMNILTQADGLIDDMVNVMLQDKEGGMWFGSYVAPRGGISYLSDGKWQLFSTLNGLPHNNITSLFEDNSGAIWAGTGLLDRGGAVQFVSTATGWMVQRVFTRRDGLTANKVRSIFQDRDSIMWFGSEYDGLARWDGGRWLILTDKDGLSQNEVTYMLQDVDGNLWIGTLNGLTRISYNALRILR